MAERGVAGLVRRDREREADEFGLQRIERRRLGVEGDKPDLVGAGDPGAELVEAPHRPVGRAVDHRLGLGRPCPCEVRRPHAFGNGGRGVRSRGRGRRITRERDFAVAPLPAGRTGEARVRFDRGDVDSGQFADPAGDRGELHRLEEGDEFLAVERRRGEVVERRLERNVAHERDQLMRDADAVDVFGRRQRFAALRLLDLAGARKQRLEVAIFADQLRRRLDPDAGRARHVVGRIAGERLDIDHLVRPDAKIVEHLGRADAPLFAVAGGRVVHSDARLDELHQVLVGRHDQDVRAAVARLPGVGGDQVVRLIAVLFHRNHAEGAHRRPHQRELRHEVGRRLGTVAFVGRVEFPAERVLRLVEDDGEVGGLDARRAVLDELQHLGGEQPDRADRQAVGAIIVLLVLPDRLKIGAEDERRAVDEENMVAGADRTVGLGHGA